MATNTHDYSRHLAQKSRHSALEEFSRDERRPAVLLLSSLALAVLFFAFGLLFGRWTNEPPRARTDPNAKPAVSTPPQTRSATVANAPAISTVEGSRRFSLLVATYDTPEKTVQLVSSLQAQGYADVRTIAPRGRDARPRYSILVGRFTQEEARDAARRLRATPDPRVRNAKIIEDSGAD